MIYAYILISIIFADLLSIFLFRFFKKGDIPFHHNVRWFFIHFFINAVITIYGFFEVKDCFYNFPTCAITHWSDNGEIISLYAIISHLYHIALFFKHLREDEWIHHIVMCFIAFPVMFNYNPMKNSSTAVWFMTGLPGMIDYFLLWLVKLGRVHKQVEKSVYVMLAVVIRSPGCIIASTSQIPHLTFEMEIVNFSRWFLFLITLWNGQYYMYVTVKNSSKPRICSTPKSGEKKSENTEVLKKDKITYSEILKKNIKID